MAQPRGVGPAGGTGVDCDAVLEGAQRPEYAWRTQVSLREVAWRLFDRSLSRNVTFGAQIVQEAKVKLCRPVWPCNCRWWTQKWLGILKGRYCDVVEELEARGEGYAHTRETAITIDPDSNSSKTVVQTVDLPFWVSALHRTLWFPMLADALLDRFAKSHVAVLRGTSLDFTCLGRSIDLAGA